MYKAFMACICIDYLPIFDISESCDLVFLATVHEAILLKHLLLLSDNISDLLRNLAIFMWV